MDFFKRLHQGVEHLLRMGYLEMPARGDPTGQRLTTQLPRQRPHLFTTPARPPAQRPDLDRRATIQLPGELLELPGDQEYLGQFVAAQPSFPVWPTPRHSAMAALTLSRCSNPAASGGRVSGRR